MSNDKHLRDGLSNIREVRTAIVDINEQRGTGDKEWNFRGLACRTDTPYEVMDYLGSYKETIESGAFRTTLNENPDVTFLINHSGLPLASTKAGTMRLWESERGLEVEATLDLTNPMSQQVMSGVARGDIAEMSFAFRVVTQQWDENYEDRLVKIINLHRGDVSVVDRGANPTTEAGEGYDEDSDKMLKQQQAEEALLLE